MGRTKPMPRIRMSTSSNPSPPPSKKSKNIRKSTPDHELPLPPTFTRSEVLPSLDDAIGEAEELVEGLKDLKTRVEEKVHKLKVDTSEEEEVDKEEDDHCKDCNCNRNLVKSAIKYEDRQITERTIRCLKRLIGTFKEEIDLIETQLCQKAYPVFPKLFEPLLPAVPKLVNRDAQNRTGGNIQVQSPAEAAPAPSPRRMSDPDPSPSPSPGFPTTPTMIIVREPRVIFKSPAQTNNVVEAAAESRHSTSGTGTTTIDTANTARVQQGMAPTACTIGLIDCCCSEPNQDEQTQSESESEIIVPTQSVAVPETPESVTSKANSDDDDDDDSDMMTVSMASENSVSEPEPEVFRKAGKEMSDPFCAFSGPPTPTSVILVPKSDQGRAPKSQEEGTNDSDSDKVELDPEVTSDAASTSTILAQPKANFLDDSKLHPKACKVTLYKLPTAIEDQLWTSGSIKISDTIEEEFVPPPSFEEEDEDSRNARLLRSALLGLQNWNKPREKKNDEQSQSTRRAKAKANAKEPQTRPRRPRLTAQEGDDDDYSDLDMPNDDDDDENELSHCGIGLGGGPGGVPAVGFPPTLGEELGGDSFSCMEDDEGDGPVVDINSDNDNIDSEEEARQQLLGSDYEDDSQNHSEAADEPQASTSRPQKDRCRSLTPGGTSDCSPRKRICIRFSPLAETGDTTDSSNEDEVKEIASFPPPRRYPKRKIPARGGGLPPRNKTLIIHLDTDSEKTSNDSEDEILGTPRRSGDKRARVLSSSDSDSGKVGQDDEIGKDPVHRDRGDEKSSSINGGDSEIELLVDDDPKGGPKPFPMPILDIREERSDAEDKSDDKDVPTTSSSLIAQELNLDPVMPDNVVKKTRTRGRRDIQPIIPDSGLRLETKRAKHEEEERLERIRKRDEELKVFASQPGFVLDPVAEPPVEVVHAITKDLKDHQKEGIESMWKACFETQALALSTDGGGCILAHSMGLGKSLQVIALLHTIMGNKELGTRFKHVLVVCPKIVVPNWREEFKFWQKEIVSTERIPVFVLSGDPRDTRNQLRRWRAEGGVGIVHYDLLETRCVPPEDVGVALQAEPKIEDAQGADLMISLAANANAKVKDKSLYEECICNPGPDVIVLDEGHNLKNMDTLIYKVIARVSTKRKIILTGTPLQNNLEEFYAMMNLIKPDLLGTSREFANRFANPIENGQFSDSLPGDVEKMKECVCVLTQLLSGCVHRKEASLLSQQLPPKHEYVIMVNLTPLQARMYNEYLASLQPDARNDHWNWHTFSKIMAHPSIVLPNPQLNDCVQEVEDGSDRKDEGPWYQKLITEYNSMGDIRSYELGAKLKVLRTILEMCECTNEKVLVFTQFRTTLDKIEDFLHQMHKEHEKDAVARGEVPSSINRGTWRPGVDYSRIDGKTSVPDRENRISRFNASGSGMKLFLLGTKSASLGINLVGANRVVVFDATYNPAHDLQGIHRVYRYGQTRECYIYRLVTPHTIEEKVFNNQILKLGLAKRVVDKSATERAIAKKIETETENSMYEKYPNPPPPTSPPSPAILEGDRVLAKLAAEHGDLIHSIREHKSLLRDDENLNDEQQKLAMEQYKKEKEKQAGPGVTTKGQATRTNSKKSRPRPRRGAGVEPKTAVETGSSTEIGVPLKIWGTVYTSLRQHYSNDEKGKAEHGLHFQRLLNEGKMVSRYYKTARDKSNSKTMGERRAAYAKFQQLESVLQNKFKKFNVGASLSRIFPPITELNQNNSKRNHSRNDKEADAKDTAIPKEPTATASELLQQSIAARTPECPEAAKVAAKSVAGRKLFVSKAKETLKAATPGPSTQTTPICIPASAVTTCGTGQMTSINLTSAVTGQTTRLTVLKGKDGRLRIKGLPPGQHCYQTANGRLHILGSPNPTPSRLVLPSGQQKAVLVPMVLGTTTVPNPTSTTSAPAPVSVTGSSRPASSSNEP